MADELLKSDDNGTVAWFLGYCSEIRKSYEINKSKGCAISRVPGLKRGWSGHTSPTRDFGPEGADEWWGWFAPDDRIEFVDLEDAPNGIRDRFWGRIENDTRLAINDR